MSRLLMLAVAVTTLVSCGSFVPVVELDKQPLAIRNKAASIRILGQGQAASTKYSVLTVVEGHSCQNNIVDPPATRVAAIEQVKFHAYEAGAEAIANLQCGGREGTSLRTNCWELISCTAEAVRLE